MNLDTCARQSSKRGLKNRVSGARGVPQFSTVLLVRPSYASLDHARAARNYNYPELPKWPEFSGSQILVELNNVSVSYDTVKVLRNH